MLTSALATLTLCALPVVGSAQALPTHIWVSVGGSDVAGCGAVTSPCRHFQWAHDNIAAGGEIDIATPGGYGMLVITKSLTITNDGVGTASIIQANAGQDAIIINDPAGNGIAVTLKGLTLDGGGVGNNGITENAGGSLTITNCSLQHFQNYGAYILSTSSLTFIVTNSAASYNYAGIDVKPQGSFSTTGIFNNVTANGNQIGIFLDIRRNTSGIGNYSIINSQILNSAGYGIGLEQDGGLLTTYLKSNSITGNSIGVVEFGGQIVLQTLGGNHFYNNGQDVFGNAPANPPAGTSF